MTATPTPYRFDRAFDGGATMDRAALEQSHAQALEAARAEAFAAGLAQGLAQAQASIEAAVQTMIETLAAQMAQTLGEVKALEQDLRRDAVTLADALAEAYAGHRLALDPTALAAQALTDILETHAAEARLVIRSSDASLDAVKTRLEPLAQHYGFTGRLIFLADPALGPYDCLVEWAHGGLECLETDRRAAIAQALHARLTDEEQV